MSHHGKSHFIRCSAWQKEDGKHSHFFRPIDPKVLEELLQELFATGGKVSVLNPDFQEPCSYSVAPSIGLKQQSCPRIHFKDQQLVVGHIMQRKCDAEIIILFPTDVTVRKAVVIPTPGLHHNHPCHAPEKQTYEARELYTQAVHEIGVIGAIVSKVDRVSQFSRTELRPELTAHLSTQFGFMLEETYRSLSGQIDAAYAGYSGILGAIFEDLGPRDPHRWPYKNNKYVNPIDDNKVHILQMLMGIAECLHKKGNLYKVLHDNFR
ncbi:hypothetical protein M422DRAFT_42761 [Sphaerobolus stellatus SS14]|nr:hypothetical protein M422DRAFT_42761 [Sphaerobolus stellatus SS14]